MTGKDLMETVAVQDVYADGIASVELVSDVNVRITYFAHMQVEGHPPVRVICARIVRPRSSIVPGQITSMIEAQDTPKSSQE